jgi:hypothetical protein
LAVSVVLLACPRKGWLAGAVVAHLGALLVAVRKPRPESFYEWWVEGVLHLHAVALCITGHQITAMHNLEFGVV